MSNTPGLGSIVYVGAFTFPDGDAGAHRVLGIGKALRAAGYSVVFAGVEKRGRPEDRQSDGRFSYEGFAYVPERDQGTSRLSRVRRGLFTHTTGLTTMQRLRRMDLTDAAAIIAYQAPALLLWSLRALCRQRGIALIADTSEWYDPRNLPGGVLGPFTWDSELRMRRMQVKTGRVIAISSYLERYYRERNCRVLRVPPLVDMADEARPAPSLEPHDGGPVRLAYAGTPHKKDLIGNAIRGLVLLRAKGIPAELHLVGPNRDDVAACMEGDAGLLEGEDRFIVYHGRVPHEAAMDLVSRSDFTVLLRDDDRKSRAGFPTKLVESLSLGVPVLTTLTSDIAEYVRDGREGIVLDDSSPQAFAAGMSRALEMPRAQWLAMRRHARERALESFDYRRHITPLSAFIADARVRRQPN